MEKTIRKNGKWAKISGKRGNWICAQGWQGHFKALRVYKLPTKDMALIYAQSWIND